MDESEELYKDIDKLFLVSNTLTSNDVKKIIHKHLSLIISHYEQNFRSQLVLRKEDETNEL